MSNQQINISLFYITISYLQNITTYVLDIFKKHEIKNIVPSPLLKQMPVVEGFLLVFQKKRPSFNLPN